MDCPLAQASWSRLLRARLRLWPALPSLVAGLLGCTPVQTVPDSPEPTPPGLLSQLKDRLTPKREFKPATLVSMGDVRMMRASKDKGDPRLTETDREFLRDDARKAYQHALEVDPKYVEAYLSLANLYIAIEEFPNAIETYQKGVKACPKASILWYKMGMCQARLKQWDAALASMRKATELEPENHIYINMLGFCLARAGRFDESYAYFAKTQGEARAHYNVARMLHHVGRPEDSRAHLRLALQAKPNYPEAQELLVSIENPRSGNVVPASFEVQEPARPRRN